MNGVHFHTNIGGAPKNVRSGSSGDAHWFTANFGETELTIFTVTRAEAEAIRDGFVKAFPDSEALEAE